MVDMSKTRPFDPADYLDDDEARAEYLRLSCESGDPEEIADAIGVVARARNKTELARKTGLNRQAIYRSFSDKGNPSLKSVVAMLKALGFELTIKPSKA